MVFRRFAGFLAIVGLALCAQPSQAQIFTWNNPAGGNFNVGGNWIGGVPASANNTILIFPNLLTQTASGYTATNDLGTFDLNSLQSTSFGASNPSTIVSAGSAAASTLRFNLNGATLPSIVNNGTANFLVQNGTATTGVTINGGTTLQLGGNNIGNLSITAVIGQSGGNGVVEIAHTGARVLGTGALVTLGGANTYSGGTTITGGNLAVNVAAGLGTGQVTIAGTDHTIRFTTTSLIYANAFNLQQTMNVTGGVAAATLSGALTGPGGLNFFNANASQTTSLTNAGNNFSGAVNFNPIGNIVGGVTLSGAGVMSGSSGFTFFSNSSLTLDNSTTAVGARLNSAASLTLNRANLTITGGAGVATTESLVSLNSTGTAGFTITPNATQPASVTFGTWNHSNNSTAQIFATGLGNTGANTGNVVVSADPGGSIGGGGGAGTPNRSILPYALGSNVTTGLTPSFIRWDASGRLTPLDRTTEYATNLAFTGTSAPNNNFRRTGTAANGNQGGVVDMNSPTTVNSLLMDTDRTAVVQIGVSLAGSGVLTVNSGAIASVQSGTGTAPILASLINNGGLAFGANPGIFHVNTPLMVNAPITGSAGIVKSLFGQMNLNEANPGLTGNIQVNSGILAFASDAALGNAANTLVHHGGLTASFTYNPTALFGQDVSGTAPMIGRAINLGPAGNNQFNNVIPNSILTYSGLISGSGGFFKNGAGMISLTNSMNSFGGPLHAFGGIVGVANDGAMGAASSYVNLQGGIFQPLGSFATSRTFFSNGASTSGIYVSGANVFQMDGLLTSQVNTGTIVKLGTGELNMTAANNFQGAVTIGDANTAAAVRISNAAFAETGGTLRLSGANGALAVAGGGGTGFTVNTGSTLHLDNSGGINNNRIGNVVVALNGGRLTMTGNSGGDTTEMIGLSTSSGLNATGLGNTVTLVQPTSVGGQVTTLVSTFYAPTAPAITLFRGTNLGGGAGDRTAVLFNTTPALTNGLIPSAGFAATATGEATDFATVVPSGSQFALQPFAAYTPGGVPAGGGGAAGNTYDQAVPVVVAANVAANAVRVSNNGSIDLTTSTLTSTTGTMLFTAGAGNVVNGTIANGTQPMRVINSGNVSIGTALSPTALTGTGGFNKFGTGTLTLFGAAATTIGNTGGVSVSQGTLALGNANALGVSTLSTVPNVFPATTMAAGAALDISALTSPVRIASLNGFGDINLGSNALHTGNSTSLIGGRLQGTANSTIAVGVPVAQVAGNTFGTSTVTLAGDNSTFAGNVEIWRGTLSVQTPTALGTGTTPIVLGDTGGTSTATLTLGANVTNFSRDITVTGGSTPSTSHTLVTSGTGLQTISSNILLNNAFRVTVGTATVNVGQAIFTGTISGTGSILQFNGNVSYHGANSYSGGYSLDMNPNLVTGVGSDSTGTTGPLGTGTITFTTFGGVLRADNGSRTLTNNIVINSDSSNDNFGVTGVNNLTLNGNVNLSGKTDTNFNISNRGVTTFGGDISNGGIVKNGPGTVVFNGASSYTGPTVVNAGKLLVNNTTGSGTGTGAVSVNDGAKLGGTGTIAGAVTVNSGGILAPGNSPGQLTIGSNLTFTGGTFEVELQGTGAGQFDQIVVTGTGNVNLGMGVASISVLPSGYTPSMSDVFVVINNTGTGTLMGNFASLPDQTVVASNVLGSGIDYLIWYGSYTGFSTSVVIAPVPEPATVLGICAFGFGAVRVIRRRFKKTTTAA